MGQLNAGPARALELVLPTGRAVRGLGWGNGPDRVLLLHEPGRDLDAWGPLPAQIARHLQVEAVAYDLPGHGLSDDPWQPDQAPALIRALGSDAADAGHRFVIAAGEIAGEVLALADELRPAGIVALSPSAVSDGVQLPRSPETAKLCFAGSQASDDLDIARRLMATTGGWAVVTSIPVTERGTGLLQTSWSTRIAEQIEFFLRDCLAARHRLPASAGNRPISSG